MHTLEHSLNQLLGTTFITYVRTLNYHWNIVGKEFIALHTLLNDQYLLLQINIDAIAEHLRMLGKKAPGTCKEFIELSLVKEQINHLPQDMTMIKELVEDHKVIIKLLNEIIAQAESEKAYDTIDFASGLLGIHAKATWFLNSHLG